MEQKEKNISELEKIIQEQKMELDHVRSLYQESICGPAMPAPNNLKPSNIRKVETAKFGIKNQDKISQFGQNLHLDLDVRRLDFDNDPAYADENLHPNTGQIFRPIQDRHPGHQMNH